MVAQIDRRRFLQGRWRRRRAARGAAGPFAGFLAGPAAAAPQPVLGPVPDLRDGTVRLWLPPGFQYRSFHDTEQPVVLDDGTVLPGRHDGMAAFRGPTATSCWSATTRSTTRSPRSATPAQRLRHHGGRRHHHDRGDPVRRGGRAFTSLNGTQMNCSGGRMPWGAWVTCEETINGPDVGPDFTGVSNVPLPQRHGFIFEVPCRRPVDPGADHRRRAVRPRGRGLRPERGRPVPDRGQLRLPVGPLPLHAQAQPDARRPAADGGRLQMLAIRACPTPTWPRPSPRAPPTGSVGRHRRPGAHVPVHAGPTAPTTNDQALNHVGNQGRAQGRRLVLAAGGRHLRPGRHLLLLDPGRRPGRAWPVRHRAGGFGNGTGQIWGYDIASSRLKLIYQSPGAAVLDFPDNVTVSHRGTLVLCEDNVNDNYVRGPDPRRASCGTSR